ncbi:coiled-coil domain-containing protein 97 [Penaeus vannamei]|uniref:coiled-coil domain-containing protein 97 n=1 Tax=Penaeus vannamei TaxID=6689 RepID=UPI000F675A86|nr:coiled-coil domain-containing protein 97-like [Penaeus vannamei]XP_027226152.1 coiled-coil domain-containing protein 97-like [Penaeus vannamei]XP_027226153.1 coiled-coil domain-containing protein 97-like [Penaeus vannamei]
MWGEFEDERRDQPTSTTRKTLPKSDEALPSEDLNQVDVPDESLSLKDRIIHHLAASKVVLKSQQRYEPDFTYEERRNIAETMLDEKPGQFLYRFGKFLQREHLTYFLKYEGNPEIDHYLTETMKNLNKHTSKITVKNRRYGAMQRLRKSGDYFSEKEMERRNPLLYDHLIGKHMTAEERKEKYTVEKYEASFSSVLLHHIDARDKKDFKKRQEEEEDDMFEEEEDEDEEEEEEEEEEMDMETQVESGEKQLLKEEFYSSAYLNFLNGKDEEFDYGQVDTSDDYDLLEIRARDDEERYFDDDDDEDEEGSNKDEICHSLDDDKDFPPLRQKHRQDGPKITDVSDKPPDDDMT